MHIQRQHKFFIEYDEVTMRRSYPPINFKVDYEGELFLVPDFHVSGLINPALELNGRITGVSNLTITENRLFAVGWNASSALTKKGNYTEEPVDGQLAFGVLILESGSRLRFEKNINLEADTLHMRKNTLLSGSPIVMTCGEMLLEGGSNITTIRQGPKAGKGTSPGIALNNVGSGGGHGGQGGPSVYTKGSVGYGSYVYPVHPGSGGGGSNGGRGGSTIKVVVANQESNVAIVHSLFTSWVSCTIPDPRYHIGIVFVGNPFISVIFSFFFLRKLNSNLICNVYVDFLSDN